MEQTITANTHRDIDNILFNRGYGSNKISLSFYFYELVAQLSDLSPIFQLNKPASKEVTLQYYEQLLPESLKYEEFLSKYEKDYSSDKAKTYLRYFLISQSWNRHYPEENYITFKDLSALLGLSPALVKKHLFEDMKVINIYTCPTCDNHIEMKSEAKSSGFRHAHAIISCDHCGHSTKSNVCSCQGCKNKLSEYIISFWDHFRILEGKLEKFVQNNRSNLPTELTEIQIKEMKEYSRKRKSLFNRIERQLINGQLEPSHYNENPDFNNGFGNSEHTEFPFIYQLIDQNNSYESILEGLYLKSFTNTNRPVSNLLMELKQIDEEENYHEAIAIVKELSLLKNGWINYEFSIDVIKTMVNPYLEITPLLAVKNDTIVECLYGSKNKHEYYQEIKELYPTCDIMVNKRLDQVLKRDFIKQFYTGEEYSYLINSILDFVVYSPEGYPVKVIEHQKGPHHDSVKYVKRDLLKRQIIEKSKIEFEEII